MRDLYAREGALRIRMRMRRRKGLDGDDVMHVRRRMWWRVTQMWMMRCGGSAWIVSVENKRQEAVYDAQHYVHR